MPKSQGISMVYNITVSEKLLKNLQNPLYNPLKNKRKNRGSVGNLTSFKRDCDRTGGQVFPLCPPPSRKLDLI